MQDGFSGFEIERYSRQLLLPQIGVDGQRTLKKSRVLIIGLGGLGCPAALYLAGAGVGTLGLVDRPGDVVERSNLHRQIAYTEDRVGSSKVESVASAICALNSLVAVEKHGAFVPANAVQLALTYDVVLDCTDNVVSRYLVNDACAAARKPLISGSAIGVEGQLTVYLMNDETPCYRCVFPQPPPPSCVGSCASAGVLGPVPGTIGTLQALEAIKIITKFSGANPLAKRMLLFDASEMMFRNVKLRSRKPGCVGCDPESDLSIPDFDYETFANGPEYVAKQQLSQSTIPGEWRISASMLNTLRKSGSNASHYLVDVRPSAQFLMCSLEGSVSVPLEMLLKDEKALEQIKTSCHGNIVLVCRRGNMSQEAVRFLRSKGLSSAVDVIGGLQAWHLEVDRSFPLY